MKNLIKLLVAGIRNLVANAFGFVMSIIGLIAASAAWLHYQSIWAVVATFILIVLVSIPIFALLDP